VYNEEDNLRILEKFFLKRTYEWEAEDGETVWSQQIIRTTKKTPSFKVSRVSIGSFYFGRPGQCYLEVEGPLNERYNAPYHDGTVWVWSERAL
jgi:hypothetical protein